MTWKASRRWLPAAAAVVTCAFAAPAAATMLLNWDVEDVASHADVVVVAEIDAAQIGWDTKHTQIRTRVEARVTEVLAGSVDVGDSLSIYQIGGSLPDGSALRIAGAPQFESGSTVVMFLEERVTGGGERVGDDWLVTAAYLGKYDLFEKDGVPWVRRPALMSGVTLVESHLDVGPQQPAKFEMSLDELRSRVRIAREVRP